MIAGFGAVLKILLASVGRLHLRPLRSRIMSVRKFDLPWHVCRCVEAPVEDL